MVLRALQTLGQLHLHGAALCGSIRQWQSAAASGKPGDVFAACPSLAAKKAAWRSKILQDLQEDTHFSSTELEVLLHHFQVCHGVHRSTIHSCWLSRMCDLSLSCLSFWHVGLGCTTHFSFIRSISTGGTGCHCRPLADGVVLI